MYVDHIAFVTSDLKAITDSLPAFCKPLAVEDQPAEGTREQYVEVADTAVLVDVRFSALVSVLARRLGGLKLFCGGLLRVLHRAG